MADLKEIVLTLDKGYVIKESGERVEILGGAHFSVNTRDRDGEIRSEIEDGIQRVNKPDLPEGINGYIINGRAPNGELRLLIPKEERQIRTFYSAVKYKELE